MTTYHRLAAIALTAVSFVGLVHANPSEPAPSPALKARSPQTGDSYAAAQLPLPVVRRSPAPLPAADGLAIHELISRVYLAEDSVDRDTLRDAVTSGFVLEDSMTGRTVGRDAFADLAVKTAALRAGSRRMALNVVVSPDGDAGAVAVHYFIAIKAFNAATKSPDLQLLSQGIVRDQLVKDHGTWRLVRRICDQVSVSPSLNFNITQRIQAARVITPNEPM